MKKVKHIMREIDALNFASCGTDDILSRKMVKAELKAARAEIDRLRDATAVAYDERNQLVALIARLFPSGTVSEQGDEDALTNTVLIDLPWGQVAWDFEEDGIHQFMNLPIYDREWEHQSDEEKYCMIADGIEELDAMYAHIPSAVLVLGRNAERQMCVMSLLDAAIAYGTQPTIADFRKLQLAGESVANTDEAIHIGCGEPGCCGSYHDC